MYEKAANMEIAKESFQDTGLHPLNPDDFPDEDFLPSEVMNRPQINLKKDPPDETGKELHMPVSVEKKAAEGCTYSNTI
jgi:hypothetical protein